MSDSDIFIWCDSCYEEYPCTNGIQEGRKYLKKQGWVHIADKDYCSRCSKGQKMKTSISVKDVIKGMTVTVKLKGAKRYTARMNIGIRLIKIACKIIGCNIEIETNWLEKVLPADIERDKKC